VYVVDEILQQRWRWREMMKTGRKRIELQMGGRVK
jgi:hypothetical protein